MTCEHITSVLHALVRDVTDLLHETPRYSGWTRAGVFITLTDSTDPAGLTATTVSTVLWVLHDNTRILHKPALPAATARHAFTLAHTVREHDGNTAFDLRIGRTMHDLQHTLKFASLTGAPDPDTLRSDLFGQFLLADSVTPFSPTNTTEEAT